MHRLKSIEVQGFRGQATPIVLALKSDANFIIGRNGTGKTTLINLVSAALAADLSVLRDAEFSGIVFKFRADKGRIVPRVEIERKADEFSTDIIYKVFERANSAPEIYNMARPARRKVVNVGGQRRFVDPSHKPGRVPLRQMLARIFRVTWLSLQRESDVAEEIDDDFEDHATDVDKKLYHVLNDLVKYFSRLDRAVAEETRSFQKRWFLSFLASDRTFQPHEISRLDTDVERRTLESIFEKFDMTPESYEERLDKHFVLLENAKERVKANTLPIADIAVVFDTVRLHSLVEQWQLLQDTQRSTYLPKTNFVEIASSMLFRKEVVVNRSNQIEIRADDGRNIPYQSLSSGEKQLLIFLSETLLQEREPYIFLADEPELSLHVEWQEELVPNLLRINSNAQVLFATHSPDIVNIYQDNVFQMEDLID